MITFSGSDYRNLKNEKGFTFSMENTSFSNITGSGCFGFSGALNKSFNFKFIKGCLVDAENNLFYNYDTDKSFTLSGIVDEARYGYYVDGSLYKKAGTRSNYKIQNFFVETTGVTLTTDLNVYSKEPRKVTVTLPEIFDVSGSITGTIANASSSYPLDVFTGYVDNSNEISLTSIAKTGHLTVSNSINFILNSTSGNVGEFYDLDLIFNTSAGDITAVKRTEASALKGIESSVLDTNLSVTKSGEGAALSFDTGFFSFNNVKTNITGKDLTGDDYRVFLKYNNGYTGTTSGWAGEFALSAGGSGFYANNFTVTGDLGSGGEGRLRTSDGAVTGLSTKNLGKNYSGSTIGLSIVAPSGTITRPVGSGLSLALSRDTYTKKFWDTWQLATGSSLTGAFTNITGQNHSLTCLSGAVSQATNSDFFARVKCKNYYDTMIQTANLIVSGVSNGKEFSITLTGVA